MEWWANPYNYMFREAAKLVYRLLTQTSNSMLKDIWREWRFPIEFSLLLGLAFFLPLREAPKNIFWLAYVLTWLVNRISTRDFGGKWSGWDSLVVAWVASGYLAAAFGEIQRGNGNEWYAVNDLVRYASLFLCVRRSRFTQEQWAALVFVLIGSGLIALAEAMWRWRVAGIKNALELASVGQVNHSAIYLTTLQGLATAAILARWRSMSKAASVFYVIAASALYFGVFTTGSRAAIAALLVLIVLMTIVLWKPGGFHSRRVLLLVFSFMTLFGLWAGQSAVEKQIEKSGTVGFLNLRDHIWKRGLEAWRVNTLFGMGMDNYSQISDERLAQWQQARGEPVRAMSKASKAPHAHSIYINTLVERGLVGFSALLLILLAWAATLSLGRPRLGDSPIKSLLWGGAFSGWFVTVFVGLFNTTLHHEHAILPLLLFGAWLACSREQTGVGLHTR